MKKIFFAMCFLCLFSVAIAQHKYHDAAMFNVHNGNVKCIEYETGTINFSEDGKLIKDESSYLSLYTKFDIIRDENGYPIELITNFDNTKFEYDNEGRVSKRTISSNNKITILAYAYGILDVTITRTELEAGQPKKSETRYDMNCYDARGNWIQKGIKGTTVREQDVSVEYVWQGGNSWREHTNVENKYRKEGEFKEIRKISFWLNNVKTFENSDSPNEIDLFASIKNPFFFGVGNEPKEVEKYIKKNGVEHKRDDYGLKDVAIFMPNSEKMFFGYAIANMCYDYNLRYKKLNYKFDILIEDKEERESFFDFIYLDAQKNDTLVGEINGFLELKSMSNSVYIRLIPSGIEVNYGGETNVTFDPSWWWFK